MFQPHHVSITTLWESRFITNTIKYIIINFNLFILKLKFKINFLILILLLKAMEYMVIRQYNIEDKIMRKLFYEKNKGGIDVSAVQTSVTTENRIAYN